MRVPFEWLKEFIDINISPEEVSDSLTMIGLEVEAKENIDDDVVFEVNVTPNRPDCLSILGIARELSASFNIPLKFPEYKLKEEDPEPDFKVEILDEGLCHRYAGRVIKGVNVSGSPQWLKNRLNKCGIRSINNIVDITNYVLLELGHPLHAFDLETLAGKTIRIYPLTKGSKIVTLDRIERKLPAGSLLIWDERNPVAIAGIMGGADTEVTDSTKDIFLESAYFEQASIRRTSRALGLKSESSYRFERGVDIELLSKAADRAASLIQKNAGGRVFKMIDVYPKKFASVPINVKYEKVNRILGTNISHREMTDIMKRLRIEAAGGQEFFTAKPPAFRLDLKKDADVIEEIARIYGYHRIKSAIPRSGISAGNSDRKRMSVLKIKELVGRAGFNEAINYSFMNEDNLNILDIPKGDRRRRTIPIRNPLRKEESLLRTTLIPALLDNLSYNFSRGVRNIRIFEMSKVFEDIGRPLPLEILCLAGIYYAEKMPSLWKEDVRGFYLVKGMIEAMFDYLHIRNYTFSPSHEPFLHPGQCCDIRVSGSDIGFIGALSPMVAERLDLKVKKPEIVVFEIDVDKLLAVIPVSLEYSPMPKFPFIERDLAIIVDERLGVADVENLIRTYPSDLIEEVSIFDLYKGGSIPEGKKSLAFTIRYRSMHRTLTEAEVEDLHNGILKYITVETGGELRI